MSPSSCKIPNPRMLNLCFTLRGTITVNWGFQFLRIAIGLGILTLLYLSQRFWYRSLWRVTSHWGRLPLRVAPRLAYIVLLLLVIVTTAQGLVFGRAAFTRRSSMVAVFAGLWFFSALFAYIAVKAVHGLDRLWRRLHTATAKKLVTGDLITGSGDSIADCVDEVRRLYAPLGTWGCNGNHEIYARAEDEAAYLYAQAGMKLLRHENALITFKGAQFNLIGVDYQRERTRNGQRQQTLSNVESLLRRDMPNILLSHNPNSFNRAAELGIELSLAGHTHGGQIQVEILDHRLSPARFITDYIAGLYQRPLFSPASTDRAAANASASQTSSPSLFALSSPPMAHIYVNRGLGTVGAPVRLGVPPEISLIVLRRA